jgi:methylenetetrahydrofolate dehydrogenase (NADP+)/methenyltetrahydrofolate cyclohydrolase
MTARVIDGRAHASAIISETATMASALPVTPTLAVLVPTDNEATSWYVRNIERTAAKVGVTVRIENMLDAAAPAIMSRLGTLSLDDSVHGVICQTPLPAGVQLADMGAYIDPSKDVDGANPTSLGRLAAGLPAYAPATAAAVLEILEREKIPLEGVRATVIGRSTVVGKPAALLLLAQHATVTVCHSRTKGLAQICAEADVLIAAIGRPGFVTSEFIRPGATIIDVGTNPTPDGGLVGDVAANAAEVAGALTPVPGGVGPVTTALLLRHVVTSASFAS